MTEDYYALLGVQPDASEAAILEAYRERAAESHPDVSDAPDADEEFHRLNQAKEVLTDDRERRAYDRLGHERYLDRQGTPNESEQTAGEPRSPNRARTTRAAGSPDWTWPDGLGVLLQGLFSRPPPAEATGAASRSGPFGSPSRSTAAPTINLESVLRERSREPNEGRSAEPPGSDGRPCPDCDGRGTFEHIYDTTRGRSRRIEPCERCDGAGTVAE